MLINLISVVALIVPHNRLDTIDIIRLNPTLQIIVQFSSRITANDDEITKRTASHTC